MYSRTSLIRNSGDSHIISNERKFKLSRFWIIAVNLNEIRIVGVQVYLKKVSNLAKKKQISINSDLEAIYNCVYALVCVSTGKFLYSFRISEAYNIRVWILEVKFLVTAIDYFFFTIQD